jgi:hypothetical protein
MDLRAAAIQARSALELAARQNDHDMLLTGDELRQCRLALSSLDSALQGEQQGEVRQEPVAYIWHGHLGEKTKSLRWTLPTQWDYTTKVEPLYAAPQCSRPQQAREAGNVEGE